MNRRIIAIDDEETLLNDYRLILSGTNKDFQAIMSKVGQLEAALFGRPAPEEGSAEDHYELATARQGEEGYNMVIKAKNSDRPFAVAFIDVRMPPGWDGVETAKMIRSIDPHIEIVIVTAFSDRERREIVKSVGMPERLLYLKKPFDPEEIRQLALALTRKWTLERRAEKYREYLEKLLTSVRRLRTLSISSVTEVLAAILDEVMFFVGSRKGFIFSQNNGKLLVEIVSDGISPAEVDELLLLISNHMSSIDDVTWMNNEVVVYPLKNHTGMYVLVTSVRGPLSEEQDKLLRLLLETCCEVLNSIKMQEQYLKNERVATIGQIAAGIVHEVNNPLAGIMGAANMCELYGQKIWGFLEHYERELASPEVPLWVRQRLDAMKSHEDPDLVHKKMLEKYSVIQNGVQRIEELMKNIRGFFKGSEVFDSRIQDVSEALEDTLSLAHNAIKYGIVVHKQWETPLMAKVDLNGFRQVFLNLILNAAQAMQGKGELWIVGQAKANQILFTIKDSGPGMPSEIKGRIFDAFYTTKPDGTGLGLSIVKGIVEKHRGSIWVESEPGAGSTFFIEIPN